MNTEIFLPILISFGITAVIGPFLIPYLRKLKFGQTEREEGVQSHLKKAGTPTMGGLMFLAAIIAVAVIWSFSNGNRPSEPKGGKNNSLFGKSR